MEPALIGAAGALLSVLLAPYLAEHIRRRAKRIDGSETLRVRQIEHQERFYSDLQAALVEVRTENRELEDERDKLRTALLQVEGVLREVQQRVSHHRDTGLELPVIDRLASEAIMRIKRALNGG